MVADSSGVSRQRGLVSIVIPVHDKTKVAKCFEALHAQTYSEIEVIPVEFAGFPAEKKNYGFRRSRGEYVYFLDEDEYLSPTVIEKCVEKAEQGFDIVAVPVVKGPPDSYTSACISIIRESTTKDMFFRRSVLDHVGLFDPSFTLCDDLDLLERVAREGYKTGVIDEGYLMHDERVTFKSLVTKTLFSRRPFGRLKAKYGKEEFKRLVRATTHRKRILLSILREPKYIPGVALIMAVRFLLRRIP